MSLYDDLPQKRYTQGTWRAILASTPVEESDSVTVVIPAFATNLTFGPCIGWRARGVDNPAAGDHALVVKDDRDQWWILEWWPKEFLTWRNLSPHFSHPFRFVHAAGADVQVATVEQDTSDEIFSCVESIIRFPLGSRVEKIDFGTPDQTFSEGSVDEQEIVSSVLRWEERAELTIAEEQDRFDSLILKARINVGAGGVPGRPT